MTFDEWFHKEYVPADLQIKQYAERNEGLHIPATVYLEDLKKAFEAGQKDKEALIEKLIDFATERTECCDVCPITDTCINSEGTCPYAGILSKDEEAVTRKWLVRKISKEIKEND